MPSSCCRPESASAQVLAADSAAGYASATWVTGSNLGYGFTGWTFANDNNTAGGTFAFDFVGASGTVIDTGGNSFGVYANGAGTPYSSIYRSFAFTNATPGDSLAVGQVFKVRFANTAIATNGYMGFCLRSSAATSVTNLANIEPVGFGDGNTRFSFFFQGGQINYYVWDGSGNLIDTGIPFTAGGLACEFALLTADTYLFTVKSPDDATILGTFNGDPERHGGQPPSARLPASTSRRAANQNAYFNSLQVSSAGSCRR